MPNTATARNIVPARPTAPWASAPRRPTSIVSATPIVTQPTSARMTGPARARVGTTSRDNPLPKRGTGVTPVSGTVEGPSGGSIGPGRPGQGSRPGTHKNRRGDVDPSRSGRRQERSRRTGSWGTNGRTRIAVYPDPPETHRGSAGWRRPDVRQPTCWATCGRAYFSSLRASA